MTLGVGAVLAIAGTGAPSHAEPLKDALASLRITHPQIQAAQKLFDAGKEREKEAFGAFLPRADFLGETGPERVDNQEPRNNGQDFDDRRDVARVQLTQNIFKGFGDQARLRAAGNNSEVLAATLEATKQAVYLEGIAAYLNVLREQKLINVAIPRVRDFRGLPLKSFDGRGSHTMGVSEHMIFLELDFNKVQHSRGMDITTVTSAKTDEEARELLRLLGMPFRVN